MNRNEFKKTLYKRVLPLILSSSIALNMSGCSSNKDEKIRKEYLKYGVELSDEKLGNYFYPAISLDPSKMTNRDYVSYEAKRHLYNQKIDLLCEADEFKNYVNVGEISWDDIVRVITENNNLNSDIKKILLEGAKNLEEKNINIDLTALYVNLEELTYEYIEHDKNTPTTQIAEFKPFEHKISIEKENIESLGRENDIKTTICHEVFGHGSQYAYKIINGKGIVGTNIPLGIFIIDENTKKLERLGFSLQEYLSDKMALYATNIKPSIYGGYCQIDLLYDIIIKSLGCDFNKLIGNGDNEIVSKARELNVENAYSLFELPDGALNVFLKPDKSSNIKYENVLANLLYDLTEIKIKNGYTYEEIENEFNEIIKSSLEEYELIDNDIFVAFAYNGMLNPLKKENFEQITHTVVNGMKEGKVRREK